MGRLFSLLGNILCLCLFAISAQANDVEESLFLDTQWFEGVSNRPTLSFIASSTDLPSKRRWALGYSNEPQWFGYVPDAATVKYFQNWPVELRVSYAPLDYVTLYVYKNEELVEKLVAGDKAPTPLKLAETAVFNVQFEANNDYILLFKVQSNSSLQFEVQASPANQSSLFLNSHALFWGAIYGILIGMLIYNLLLYSGTREASFGSYIGFLTCFTFALAFYNGHYRLFLPEDWLNWSSDLIIPSVLASVGFLLMFTAKLLVLPKVISRNALGILIVAPLFIFVRIDAATILLSSITLLVCILCIGSGIYGLLFKRPFAKLYLVAWAPALFTIVILMLHTLTGSFENLSVLQFILPVSIVFALTLFSMATSEKIRSAKQAAVESAAKAQAAREQLNEFKESEDYNNNHCYITGLPNKAVFFETIVEKQKQFQGYIAIFLESRQMDEVRAVFGVNQEESLLRLAAMRFREIFSHSSLALSFEIDPNDNKHVRVARTNSQQFCFVIEIDDIATATSFAELTYPAINQPFTLNGLTLDSQFHMALVPVFDESITPEELLKRANITIQHSFETDKQICTYSNQIEKDKERRLHLMAGLRNNLNNSGHEFDLFLQPQIELETNLVKGFESLIRWQHPTLGLIFPDEFIELAEAAGLINEITLWVLNQSCIELQKMAAKGLDGSVSINISAKDLMDESTVAAFQEILTHHRVPKGKLLLEITETATVRNIHQATRAMHILKASGFMLAIDDFGTGHSSFEYLKDFPVKELKIDKSFIMDFEDEKNQLLTKTMVELAQTLNLEVVAEGVENEQAARALKELGCEFGQGYLWSRPQKADDAIRWAVEHNQSTSSDNSPEDNDKTAEL